jgi:UDP-2,3-diacylglucosamine pyrophosphatase LpxH
MMHQGPYRQEDEMQEAHAKVDESEIIGRILTCEDREPSLRYGKALVALRSDSSSFHVISDLHLGSGLQRDGSYDGNENFLSDASFARLIEHLLSRRGATPPTLIINGDFIDFFRIALTPRAPAEYEAWRRALTAVGIEATVEELAQSITAKERTYGLATQESKSIWKLTAVLDGHPEFFDALAAWLKAGGRLLIVKGNHDLDWFWPRVRAYLRFALSVRLGGGRPLATEEALSATAPPRLLFIDHAVLINGELYVEHGHRFDKFSRVLGGATRSHGSELNIPFGGFFNRYLLNKIELSFPFIDNVRPREALLPLLVRERFPLALRLLGQHLPFMILLIPKRYYLYMFGRVLAIAAAVILPAALTVWQAWSVLLPVFSGVQRWAVPFVLSLLFDVSKSFGWLVLAYLLARLVAYFQLEEPSSLARFGRRELEAHANYRVVIFGHTHNPDVVQDGGRWFFNTGTWIPIIEISSADVRQDRTYTVAEVELDLSGAVQRGRLLRWNDDAGRLDVFTPMKRVAG